MLESGFYKKSKGAAMIEFAIILPLLLIIMMGVLVVSLFLIQDNTLNKSVRESSRYLARNLGLQGCYTNIGRTIIAYNMDTLFPFIENDSSKFFAVIGSYTPETVCVNDSDGAVDEDTATRIDDTPSCASIASSCAAGTHLHVRVLATYNAPLVIPGLMGFNFTPSLKASSIMRVQ